MPPLSAPSAPARSGQPSGVLSKAIADAIAQASAGVTASHYEAAGLVASPLTPPSIIGATTWGGTALAASSPGKLKVDVGGDSDLVILRMALYTDQAAGVLFNITPSIDNAPLVLGSPLHSKAVFPTGSDGWWALPRPLQLNYQASLAIDLTNLAANPQHVWVWFSGYRRKRG